ncbi:hypothetical protein MNBD_ALPHA11-1929 [hydrothermal vent metagenome]|uniref:Uncharacterized protein n=1 Tax=hydrothermal vent metagenome TaxID=652676 RepID=A0A3B0U2D4_9ZZZZ
MTKSALAAILAFFAFGSAASATASIFCAAGDNASVSITIGSVAVSSIVGVDIEVGDVFLSTVADRGEQIALLQSFVDAETISIDLGDPNFERIVAQIRLFTAYEGADQAIAGTLLVNGTGAYPLVCEGP